jgi:hypothetical protein
VKSANPLLDTAGVKSVLIQASECLETGTDKPCSPNSPLGGVSNDAMKKLGYGVPKADKAVQAALGGPTAKNRLTPLFAYYNINGDNHFYTTNPQMAIAAKRNTLLPAPKYRFSPTHVDCAVTPTKCVGNGYVDEVFTTTLPDGTIQSATAVETVFQSELGNGTVERARSTVNNVAGISTLPVNPYVSGRTFTALDPTLNTSGKIRPIAISTFPLTYQEMGLPIPGYPNLPCGSSYQLLANTTTFGNGPCNDWPARAVAMLLTTHVDPTSSGRTLLPVYRFSCDPDKQPAYEGEPGKCNLAVGANKDYHVAFRYDSRASAFNTIISEGYDFDGIEGYVFDPLGAQPVGTTMLCSRRNTVRHDRILVFDPAGTCGVGSPSTDPYAVGFVGTGFDDNGGAGEKIGWAYPVQRPKALPDQPSPASHSFNGDQYADIFWMKNDGSSSSVWINDGAAVTPTFVGNTATGQSINSNWRVAGIGDFDGDGKADILWRGVAGADLGKTRIWIMNGNMVISSTDVSIPSQNPVIVTNYEVAGVADFNGDGRADILWRHVSNGNHLMWYMQGATIMGNGNAHQVGPTGTAAPAWKVVGVGDMNGDGKADLLWRNSTTGAMLSWLMSGNSVINNYTAAYTVWGNVSSDWTVKGLADVTGDGHADVIWYNTNGTAAVWKIVDGQYNVGSAIVTGNIPQWQIVGVRDFDGDKKADILWRHTGTGANTLYLLDGFAIKSSPGLQAADISFKVQPVIP